MVNRMGNIVQKEPDKIFSMAPHAWLEFGTRLIQTLLMKSTYVEETMEIYQSIRTLVHRKGIKMEKRRYFEKCIGLYFEFGFSYKLIRNAPPNHFGFQLEPRGRNGIMHFGGLQEYIRQNTRVTALSFDKLAHYQVETTEIRILLLRTISLTMQKLISFIRKSGIFFAFIEIWGCFAFLKVPLSFLLASLRSIKSR